MATLPPIRIVFKAVDQMSRQTREMTQSLRTLSSTANRVGLAMTAAFTVPIMAAGTAAVRTLADTSKAFNTMRANTSQGAASYDTLRQSAIEFATTSQKTTAEVIDAMTELGRAGKNTSEIMGMYRSAVNLSIAGDVGADRAAQTLTNLMNVYSLGTEETERVADMMAATVSGSAQNFEDFAMSMEHGAINAQIAGMSFQDAMATSGMLANFGIRGSGAGTQMKAMQNAILQSDKMMEHFGITIEDGNGGIRDMTQIYAEMGRSLAGMSEAERLIKLRDVFGRIGIRHAGALSNTAEEWANFSNMLENSSGTVDRMANEMNQGLYGALIAVRNAWDGLIHRMQSSTLERILRAIADGMSNMANLPTAAFDALTVAALALAGAGPALLALGAVLSAISALPALTTALSAIANAAAGAGLTSFGTGAASVVGGATAGSLTIGTSLSTIAGVLAGPVGWAILAIAAVVASIAAIVYTGWTTFKNMWKAFTSTMEPYLGTTADVMTKLKDSWEELKAAYKPMLDVLIPVLKLFAGGVLFVAILAIANVLTAIATGITWIVGLTARMVAFMAEKVGLTDLADRINNAKDDTTLGQAMALTREAPDDAAIASTTASAVGASGEENTFRLELDPGLRVQGGQDRPLWDINYMGIGGV